jgi:hypothetical protein
MVCTFCPSRSERRILPWPAELQMSVLVEGSTASLLVEKERSEMRENPA